MAFPSLFARCIACNCIVMSLFAFVWTNISASCFACRFLVLVMSRAVFSIMSLIVAIVIRDDDGVDGVDPCPYACEGCVPCPYGLVSGFGVDSGLSLSICATLVAAVALTSSIAFSSLLLGWSPVPSVVRAGAVRLLVLVALVRSDMLALLCR